MGTTLGDPWCLGPTRQDEIKTDAKQAEQKFDKKSIAMYNEEQTKRPTSLFMK